MPRILLRIALLLVVAGLLFQGPDRDVAPVAAILSRCQAAPDAPDAAPLPSAQRLAWAEGSQLWTLLDGCANPQLLRDHPREIGQVRWSPEGDAIALQDGTGTTVVRLDGGTPPRTFGSEEFAWLDNDHLLIGRSRLPVPPHTLTLVVIDIITGQEREIDGAMSFAAHDGTVAFWQDAGPCPREALPRDSLKPGSTVDIERRCPRLVLRPAGADAADEPTMRITVNDMVAVMPDGVPPLGLISPGTIDWSPDGEWIVFRMCGYAASGCVDSQQMFELNVADGTLAYVGDTAGPIAWAPDSSSYVYVQSGGRPYDAYPRPMMLRRAGSAEEATTISAPSVEDWEPAWSPDSSMLAFASFPSIRIGTCQACAPELSGEGIWTVRSDGSERRQLTSSPQWVDSSPQWPLDGEWILFERRGPRYIENEGYPMTQLWLMRSDGSDQRMIADLSANGPRDFPLDLAYDWWTPPN